MSTFIGHHCLKPVIRLSPYPTLFRPTVVWSTKVTKAVALKFSPNFLEKLPFTVFLFKRLFGKSPVSLLFVKPKLKVDFSSPPLRLILFTNEDDLLKKVDGSFLAATQGVGWPKLGLDGKNESH